MKKAKEFYVGWKPTMSDDNSGFLRKRIGIGLAVLVALITIIVAFQKPFKNHNFLLGQIDEINGIYYDSPYPMIVADQEALPKDISSDILLVGFGKYGAKSTMDNIQKVQGPLTGQKITLQGTLIYGDDKTLMELTKGADSFIQKSILPVISYQLNAERTELTMQGEILDPKCYFGVMKPGEGKIHKSCAIRCISGGIPPVFRHDVMGDQSSYEYYLIIGPNGEPINAQILQYVAENISISGQSSTYHSWKVLYVDPDAITSL